MKCVYIFDPDVSNFHYGKGHPMKPHRIALTNSLIHSYDLEKYMDIVTPKQTQNHLENYHTKEYISSLKNLSKTDDCPCFPGIEEYCNRYSLNSITAAQLLNNYDIAINWSGGLHHAKKTEASGFCYVNDIVLAIQYLLTTYKKVLYIDIDIHHGDGVEEAFFDNEQVVTLSFHKFGDNFFPGTGEIFNGCRKTLGTVINVPLKSGMDDFSYKYIFEPIVEKTVEKHNPDVIVIQCGADSLAGDRLGCFNLSIYGHGECLKFVKNLGKKMLVLGGGGYNIKNVSRCWTYETSILCDVEISNDIPKNNIYYEYFSPDYTLHPTLNKKFENHNTRRYLDVVKNYILEELEKT